MIENTFIKVFGMSITASVVAFLVMFIRQTFGKRLPKTLSYALWVIVIFRLLIPFSLPSMFSIFNMIPTPEKIDAISYQEIKTYSNTNEMNHISDSQHDTENNVSNANMDRLVPEITPKASVDARPMLSQIFSWIWLIGVVGLFLFSVIVYFCASYRLKEAILYKNNPLILQCSKILKLNRKIKVYISDRVNTPVVCGLIKARIIIPSDLAQSLSERELKHILVHELVHIKRFDYLFKPLFVLALCVHWFNPIVWLSFILFQKDMEMSCDEKVMSVFENDIRSEYATSLIKLAAKQNVFLNGGLLAFGESNIKSRIKGIMTFKKPKFLMGILVVIILVVTSVVLLTNGQGKQKNQEWGISGKANKRIEDTAEEYYLEVDPNNKGELKIHNIKEYGTDYLVLTEKHSGDAHSGTILFLVDKDFSAKAAASGDIPLSPCFSANLVKHQGKSIIYGNFKNKKWDPKTDIVSEVQIDNIEIEFEDGSVFNDSVSMDKGYIVVVDTLSGIKDIKLYNNKGELQSDLLNESYLKEYGFRSIEADKTDKGNSGQSEKNAVLTVEEIINNHMPKIYTPNTYHDRLEYQGRWSGNVMPGLREEMAKSGWELLETRSAKLFYSKVIEGVEVKISLLPKEQGGPEEINATTVVVVKMEDSVVAQIEDDSTDLSITGKRKLWTKDGWSYFIEQVPRGGKIPLSNLVGKLSRQNTDGTVQVIDELVMYLVGDSNKSFTIFPAGDRIVFVGFAGTEVMDFKTRAIISIKEDGSDRRIYDLQYRSVKNFCYDNGYLYYEGWTNDNAFPRPICRMNTDFSKDIKMADIDGAFITVHNGYAYYLNGSIYRLRLDWSSKPELWDKAVIGKQVISVQKIADTEYNVVYDENSKPYILRLKDDKRKAFDVVQKYFIAFENADYKTMSALATEYHNTNLVHDGDVWGMKWAKAKEIELVDDPAYLQISDSESTLVYGVSVEMETVKTSAQYPSTQTFFYIVLIKDDNGIWRVDRYTTG